MTRAVSPQGLLELFFPFTYQKAEAETHTCPRSHGTQYETRIPSQESGLIILEECVSEKLYLRNSFKEEKRGSFLP